jgi:hypothetical protein
MNHALVFSLVQESPVLARIGIERMVEAHAAGRDVKLDDWKHRSVSSGQLSVLCPISGPDDSQ